MPNRGRRGRGRGGHQGFRENHRDPNNPNDDDQGEVKKDVSIKDDPRYFFTGTASAQQHLEAQTQDCGRYSATYYVLVKNGIKIAQNAKVKALAIALGRNDRALVSAFLQCRSHFGLVEVLKAITLLDAGRQVRLLEKKLKSLELSSSKVKKKTYGKIKRDINNLNKLKLPVGSASGSVCKHISKWVKGFTKDELEFYAIQFPKEPWKKLADICHFDPKDFEGAPWFLSLCFGGEVPSGLVEVCQGLNAENINERLHDLYIPFSIAKPYKAAWDDKAKQQIAENEPKLDTLLWNYEDLQCELVEKIIYDRIVRGDSINLSNGKLLERLLTITLRLYDGNNHFIDTLDGRDDFYTRLIEAAEPKLTSICLPLESPVAILGDASPSMEVAIRTSTIIASLITSICSAKLVFFDSENTNAPFLPNTVKQMLKLALITRTTNRLPFLTLFRRMLKEVFITKTTGFTCPAASLYPFYQRKEVVKTFLLVTDEEENGDYKGYRFTPLFKKYYEEVYPANLVFVSFLRSQNSQGQMVTQLEAEGFTVKQLKLHGDRPDLQKLDDLFGQLSSASSIEEEILGAENDIKHNGVVKLFEGIKNTGVMQHEE